MYGKHPRALHTATAHEGTASRGRAGTHTPVSVTDTVF